MQLRITTHEKPNTHVHRPSAPKTCRKEHPSSIWPTRTWFTAPLVWGDFTAVHGHKWNGTLYLWSEILRQGMAAKEMVYCTFGLRFYSSAWSQKEWHTLPLIRGDFTAVYVINIWHQRWTLDVEICSCNEQKFAWNCKWFRMLYISCWDWTMW